MKVSSAVSRLLCEGVAHFLDTTDTANKPIWMWALASTAHTSFISMILVSFTDLNDLAGNLCSCPGNPGFRVHLQQKGGVPPCVGLPSPRRNRQEEVSDCALVKPHHCFLAHCLFGFCGSFAFIHSAVLNA
jgi:hypothetical protein